MLVHMLIVALAAKLTETIIATKISATTRPYSIAVAPLVLRAKARHSFNIACPQSRCADKGRAGIEFAELRKS